MESAEFSFRRPVDDTRSSAAPPLGWALLVALLAVHALPAVPLAAQTIDQVQWGIDQSSKVGCWNEVVVTVNRGEKPAPVGDGSGSEFRVDIDAADSDGAVVTYIGSRTWQPSRGTPLTIHRYVKLGRLSGEVVVRLVGDGEKSIDEFSVPLRGVAQATQPRIVSVFGDIGLRRWTRRRKFSDGNRPVIAEIAVAPQLPMEHRGWDGVERVTLATASLQWQDVQPEQWKALDDWIRLGGELILLCGGAGEAVAAHPTLAAWLPGRLEAVQVVRENPALEDFGSAETALPPLAVTRLTEIEGRVEARFGRRGRDSGPAIIRRTYGFGTILFCAVDIDDEPMKSWESRERFVENMLDLRRAEWMTEETSSRGAAYGYTEMTGQLRAALDSYGPRQESSDSLVGATRGEPSGGNDSATSDEEPSTSRVRLLAFSAVAGGLVLYLVIIGPVDFFLLKRFAPRMEWTWVTFPVVLLLACFAILALQRWRLGDREIRLNQVDLVDVDMVQGTIRGTTWASLFTASPSVFEVSATTDPAVVGAEIPRTLLTWQGHPGKGLGGFQSVSGVRWASSRYDITNSDDSTRLRGLPLGAATSRSLITQWNGTQPAVFDTGGGDNRGPTATLTETTSRVLEGYVTNPLDIPISNPILVYQNTIYRLGEQLRPGQRVGMNNRPRRALEWELTRRRGYDAKRPSAYTNTKWNPSEMDVRRLMEVMLHYEAAGGSAYTDLGLRYQGEIDLSEHLSLNRAILWGEVRRPAVKLTVNQRNATDGAERHWAFYRIVLPVISQ